MVGPVEEATATELGALPEPLRSGALAATALELARQMDADNSATSKSMCAKALVETMTKLADMAPRKREKDDIDDLSARRQARKRATGT